VLFKLFWQKRGKSGEAEASSEPAPGEVERTVIGRLTHTSEFHLERLEKLLELRFQKDFGELDDERLRSLIHYASRIQDSDIQRELLLFYLNCPPSIQAYLRSGDTVEESHLLHRAPKPWL
jgi:hypothetical protein